MTAATLRRWTTRRRRKPLEGVAAPRAVIEFVPGAENGQRAYLWIGNDNGCYATIDARDLARWVEGLRSDDS